MKRILGNPICVYGVVMFCFIVPDVIVNSNASKGTARVYAMTFHELAHASHHKKVGSGYWVKYINYIITYGAYGNGTGKNAGYAGVGEMWAYYIAARLAEEEFGTTDLYYTLISGWIPPEINKRVVNEADYSIQDIYSSLNSHVNTIPRLKKEYNSRIGKNISTVNQIFNKYGY